MTESFPTLASAIDYIQDGRRAVHEGSCPGGQFACAACISFLHAAAALDIIREGGAGPATCRPVRLFLHDAVCRSGCQGESREEHARRHADTVRELRRYVKEAL